MIPKIEGIKNAMKDKKDKYIYIKAIVMVEQATGWIEIHSVQEACRTSC